MTHPVGPAGGLMDAAEKRNPMTTIILRERNSTVEIKRVEVEKNWYAPPLIVYDKADGAIYRRMNTDDTEAPLVYDKLDAEEVIVL